jgi:hypothetical protein
VAVIKFNLDYLLVVGVALVLSIANIIGFTKCRKGISKHYASASVLLLISHTSTQGVLPYRFTNPFGLGLLTTGREILGS